MRPLTGIGGRRRVSARYDLGLLARDHGDLGRAAELLRASLRDFRELDYPWAVAWSAWGLGTTLSAQARLEEARPLLAEALRIYIHVNDPRGVAQCLEALAYVASEQAHYETAARRSAALVASGRTNRQIGRMLGISEKTAEVHLHHVMSKLDVRSRAEVAAWAVTHRL
jgi:DNA-binding CsgD family transcriptional regulator